MVRQRESASACGNYAHLEEESATSFSSAVHRLAGMSQEPVRSSAAMQMLLMSRAVRVKRLHDSNSSVGFCVVVVIIFSALLSLRWSASRLQNLPFANCAPPAYGYDQQGTVVVGLRKFSLFHAYPSSRSSSSFSASCPCPHPVTPRSLSSLLQ